MEPLSKWPPYFHVWHAVMLGIDSFSKYGNNALHTFQDHLVKEILKIQRNKARGTTGSLAY
jgi:hypothetical protein